jgi:hypothetical protein
MTEKEIVARARELYALSDQGEWGDLPEWMKRAWIEAAEEESKGGCSTNSTTTEQQGD